MTDKMIIKRYDDKSIVIVIKHAGIMPHRTTKAVATVADSSNGIVEMFERDFTNSFLTYEAIASNMMEYASECESAKMQSADEALREVIRLIDEVDYDDQRIDDARNIAALQLNGKDWMPVSLHSTGDVHDAIVKARASRDGIPGLFRERNAREECVHNMPYKECAICNFDPDEYCRDVDAQIAIDEGGDITDGATDDEK
jgi:hypothetical protein